MTYRRAGRVVARLGVLMESATLLAVGEEPFDRTSTRVLRELASHLDAEATLIPPTGDAPPVPSGAAVAECPVSVGDRLLGRLRVTRRDGNRFDRDDLRLVQDVAAQLASGWALHELPGMVCTGNVLEAGFDTSPIGVQLVRGDGTIVRVNPAFCRLVDRDAADLEGRHWHDLLVDPGPAMRRAHGSAGSSGQSAVSPTGLGHRHVVHRYRRRDGTTVRAHVVLTPVFPDGPEGDEVLLVQVLAVSSAERDELDELTGVATRRATLAQLDEILARTERPAGTGVAVAVVDIDHFDAVNVAYGHTVGDEALRAVARAVCGAVRPGDIVGRLDGDAFLVVLDDIDATTANAVGAAVAAQLDQLWVPAGDDLRCSVGASIGMAWTSPVTETVEAGQLLARAGRGVTEAKRRGRGRLWRHDARTAADEPAVTARDLRLALDRGEFTLSSQPIVASSTLRLHGVEALLRWNHPSGRQIGPDRFLDPLLESGLINEVGARAATDAIARLAEWRAMPGGSALTLHINISPAELAHEHYAGVVRAALDATGVDPAAVCVELTEQALDGTIVSVTGLRRLAATGERIALDDLGTGVSSLSHLRLRPLHGIKIDRTFISGPDRTEADRSIVLGLIAMARGLGLEITAEGVETSDQARWLADAGCDLLQGWRFSRAVDPDTVTRMVALQPV